MKYIAHRGNLTGPNPSMENNPDYVFEALKQGFDVEVDVWCIGEPGERKYFLGHDKAQYPVEFSFLKQKGVWCHAKNFATYRALQEYGISTFLQEHEVYVTTTNGYMWWHEGHSPYSDASAKYSILTALSVQEGEWLPKGYYGLCSDYAKYCRDGKPVDPILVPSWWETDLAPIASTNNPFDILFLDVDGVLSGYKHYDHTHTVISKSFVDKDFTAIKRMKAAGVEVVILSGDDWNKGMAKRRKIQFIHIPATEKGIIDKLPHATEYLGGNPNWDRVAYIGDDYYDIPLLEEVGFAYCPGDAIKEVKEAAFPLDSWGGEGCIAEIYSRLQWNETYPYDFL